MYLNRRVFVMTGSTLTDTHLCMILSSPEPVRLIGELIVQGPVVQSVVSLTSSLRVIL